MLYFSKFVIFSSVFAQDLPIESKPYGELIPLHHDTEGFAPLTLSEHQLDVRFKPYWNNIPSYIERLKLAFSAECAGERALRGIHMPNWIIWGSPSIIQKKQSLTLYLGNQSMDTPIKIGKLDLVNSGKSTVDGVAFIKRFLDQYIDYDNLVITSYKAPLKQDSYTGNWTEIDDLVIQMLLASSKYQLSNTDQDEAIRLIGEFFRWRGIISEFCKRTINRVDDLTLPLQFEEFLIKQHKLSAAEAKKYKYFLDIRRQHLGLILKDPSQSEEVITAIFKKFTLYGLTKDQDQADRYREQLFPK